MRNPIKKRKYYAVKLKLISPLAISGGQDYYSDADVLRNGEGKAFIPGTSMAGAFRNYLFKKEGYKKLFGYAEDGKGLMSAVYISDLYFEEYEENEEERRNPKISLRDRVKLLEDKTVENKFDQEILETGASGILYLEYVIRKEQENINCEDFIETLIRGMQSGEIRFGSDKNRGYGRVSVLNVYEKEFGPEDLDEWLKFQKENKENLGKYGDADGTTYQKWKETHPGEAEQYIRVTVPLRQKGGISIRTYSAEPGKADYSHITCNGKSVIPGSSWSGAIRADARNILVEAGIKNAERVLEAWFGCMKQKEKQKEEKKEGNKLKGWQSLVVTSESILEGGTMLPMTRNKISRFDSSTVDGALYSEISYVGGKTNLELMVKKDLEEEYKAVMGLLYLVIRDIQKGYLAIGGQTAVGRGIFEADGEICCNETLSADWWNECLKELYGRVAEK